MKYLKKGADDKEDSRVMIWAAVVAILLIVGALALNAFVRSDAKGTASVEHDAWPFVAPISSSVQATARSCRFREFDRFIQSGAIVLGAA